MAKIRRYNRISRSPKEEDVLRFKRFIPHDIIKKLRKFRKRNGESRRPYHLYNMDLNRIHRQKDPNRPSLSVQKMTVKPSMMLPRDDSELLEDEASKILPREEDPDLSCEPSLVLARENDQCLADEPSMPISMEGEQVLDHDPSMMFPGENYQNIAGESSLGLSREENSSDNGPSLALSREEFHDMADDTSLVLPGEEDQSIVDGSPLALHIEESRDVADEPSSMLPMEQDPNLAIEEFHDMAEDASLNLPREEDQSIVGGSPLALHIEESRDVADEPSLMLRMEEDSNLTIAEDDLVTNNPRDPLQQVDPDSEDAVNEIAHVMQENGWDMVPDYSAEDVMLMAAFPSEGSNRIRQEPQENPEQALYNQFDEDGDPDFISYFEITPPELNEENDDGPIPALLRYI